MLIVDCQLRLWKSRPRRKAEKERRKKRNARSIEIKELNKSKIFKKLNINEMRLCSSLFQTIVYLNAVQFSVVKV